MTKLTAGTRRALALLGLIAAATLTSGCATDRGHWYTGVEGGPTKS